MLVNDSVAQQLYQMGFTDVALRYVTPEELTTSKVNLNAYGIDIWIIVNQTLFLGDITQEDFKVTLNEQSVSGVSNYIIDDANWLWYSGQYTTTAKNNFLSAMRTFGDSVLQLRNMMLLGLPLKDIVLQV